jgi:hypothetical protein
MKIKLPSNTLIDESDVYEILDPNELKFIDDLKQLGMEVKFFKEPQHMYFSPIPIRGLALGYIKGGNLLKLKICGVYGEPLLKLKEIPTSIKNLTHLEELKFKYFQTDDCPQEIASLPSLFFVKFFCSEGGQFPNPIAQNPNLGAIELKMSMFQSFPPEMLHRKSPLYLSFEESNFVQLSPFVEKMNCVTQLRLIHEWELNEDVLAGLTKLRNLEELHISGAFLYHIPKSWVKFPSLICLNLFFNSFGLERGEIEDLGDSTSSEDPLIHIPRRRRCRRRHRRAIIEFPKEICTIKTLKQFYIHGNITNIPDEFKDLSNLEMLNINSEILHEFPPWIYKLPSLKEFYFNGSKFYPEDYDMCLDQSYLCERKKRYGEMFQWLEKASLFNKDPTILWSRKVDAFLGLGDTEKALNYAMKYLNAKPQCGRSWEILSDVYIERGELLKALDSVKNASKFADYPSKYSWKVRDIEKRIENEDQQKILDSLSKRLKKKFYLYRDIDKENRERQKASLGYYYPDTMVKFMNYKIIVLKIKNCGLKEIPPEIFSFSHLKILSLENNDIPHIPDDIQHLKKLETIILDINPITKFPKVFSQMKSLKRIYLKHCEITELDPMIFSLSSLDWLSLKGNKIRWILPEIIHTRPGALINLENNWITELPDEMGNMDHDFRLVVSLGPFLFWDAETKLASVVASQYFRFKDVNTIIEWIKDDYFDYEFYFEHPNCLRYADFILENCTGVENKSMELYINFLEKYNNSKVSNGQKILL